MADIMDTGDLPEDEVQDNLNASEESKPEERIEFHVQMRGYTQRDMDALIVEAAARLIVGRHGESKLAKEIEQRCTALTAERADKALSTVTAEIMDQPLTPSFASAKAPVTMREFLGLYGREYLAATVGKYDGDPNTSSYNTVSRMEYLVGRALDTKFQKEMESATNAVVREIQAEVKGRLEAALAAEKARYREALAKASA